MNCPDCGSDAGFETDTVEDPARPGFETSVTYCVACGEVV